MLELCRFYNIVIKMIYSDQGQHNKPHFHVYFAEYEASVGIRLPVVGRQSACQAVEDGPCLGCHP